MNNFSGWITTYQGYLASIASSCCMIWNLFWIRRAFFRPYSVSKLTSEVVHQVRMRNRAATSCRIFNLQRCNLYRPRRKFVDQAPYYVNNAAARGEAAATSQKRVHELSSPSVGSLIRLAKFTSLPPLLRNVGRFSLLEYLRSLKRELS